MNRLMTNSCAFGKMNRTLGWVPFDLAEFVNRLISRCLQEDIHVR